MSDRIPTYRKKKTRTGTYAVVTLPDGFGGRRDVLLGHFGTSESRSEYRRVLAEWEANSRRLRAVGPTSQGLTVKELIAAFWPHVERHYRRADGSPTQEVQDYKQSLRPMKHLYGASPVGDFGPLALKAVRSLMVKGYDHPRYGKQPALARGVVNQRIGRIKRMFRWAVENELVPAMAHHALVAVRGLERGRSEARETRPVQPVPVAFVEAVLPFLSKQVAAMVELQLLTGARSGEIVIMRGIDLDTSGAVWFYKPTAHKTAYRGHSRVIAIGPKGQAVLRPWLRLNVEEYLFQPREADAFYRQQQRAIRKSKVQPSQQHRSKPSARKKPGHSYTSRSYHQAITKGIEKANRFRACEPCKRKEPTQRCETCRASAIPHWHPHQLRHTKATEIRRTAGLDAARAVLGHTSPVVTEVYAELDVATAAEVMAKIG
jgi:integrase